MFGVSLAIAAGLAMAAQSRINGQLSVELHDSLLAAVISFGGGLLVLVALVPLLPAMRAGMHRLVAALRDGGLRPWQCLGGVGGAMFVAGQSVTVGVLGVSLFTVGVVAGQTVSGLFVDRMGLGPAGAQRLSLTRVLGAALTLVAVAWSVSGGLNVAGGPGRLWLLSLPVVAGVFVAVQQAINGHVGKASGSALTAALINFTVGTVVLVLAWLISLIVRGGPAAAPENPVLYLGGLVGIAFIALASLVVRWTGVLLLGLSAIAGQLIGSVLLDVFLPAAGRPLSITTLSATALALVAVVIAGMGGRRRWRPRLEQ